MRKQGVLALLVSSILLTQGGAALALFDLSGRTYSPSVITLNAETMSSISDALDAFYAVSVNPGQIAVLWLADGAPSGVLLRTSHKAFMVDPAGTISGSDVNKLQRLDLLLITHEHSDHFQKSATLAIQAKTGTVVIANPGAFVQLSGVPSDKLIEMSSTETLNVNGVEIIAVASIHPATEPLTYLVLADFPFFHGSDSGYNSALIAYKSLVKLAIVPTGGPSPTASPQEALNMVRALDPTDAAPVHGTLAQNNEFASLLAQQAPNVQYHALTATSSVMVGEFSGMELIALTAALAMSILILRVKRRETSKWTHKGVCSCRHDKWEERSHRAAGRVAGEGVSGSVGLPSEHIIMN